MAFFQEHKDMKRKLDIALYDNLRLLEEFYPLPTNPPFDCFTFTKEMFVKSNRAAFNNVIFYLLNIFDSAAAKQMFVGWPRLDSKQDAKFRTEFVTYLKNINLKYNQFQIPVPLPSHIVSPGGYQTLVLLVKLSQLVLFDHLKRAGCENILAPAKQIQNLAIGDFAAKFLKGITETIKNETKCMLSEIPNELAELAERADNVTQQTENVNKEIIDAREALAERERGFAVKFPSDISLFDLRDDISTLRERVEKMLEINTKFKECSDHLALILTLILEHDKEMKIPSEVAPVVTSGGLDLIKYFKALTALIKKTCLHMRRLPLDTIKETIQVLDLYATKYEATLSELQTYKVKVECLLAECRKFEIDE